MSSLSPDRDHSELLQAARLVIIVLVTIAELFCIVPVRAAIDWDDEELLTAELVGFVLFGSSWG